MLTFSRFAVRICGLALAFFGALLVLPSGVFPQAAGSTLKNTMMHFYLTNSRNVNLALDREELILSATRDTAKLNIMTSAYEVVFDGAQQIRVGMVGFRSPERRTPNGLQWNWQGGLTFYDTKSGDSGGDSAFFGPEVSSDENLLAFNVLGGFLLRYKDLYVVQANGAFNFVVAQGSSALDSEAGLGSGPTFVEAEHASASISFPSLSAYANFKYDLVTQSPRDAELGFFHRWKDRSLGNLRLAASYRHSYPIIASDDGGFSGGFVTNEFKADTSGVLELRDYAPFGKPSGDGDFLRMSAGVAMGERLRYTFGELQLGLPRPDNLRADFFVFLRVGRALSRRDDRYYNGLALGLDLPFIRGPEGGKEHEGIYSAYARLWLGFQDYDTIDRIGAVSPLERDDSVEEQEELSSEDLRNMSFEELNEWARNRRQSRANEEVASSQSEMNLSNTLTIGGTLNWSW